MVLKPAFVTPPPDEEEFERVSDCFVTACTRVVNDNGASRWVLERYGIDGLFGENHFVGYHQMKGKWRVGGPFTPVWGIPIHDACWQIFQSVSILRLGIVDLQGFFALWEVSNVPLGTKAR
jgi:hypothetical protein